MPRKVISTRTSKAVWAAALAAGLGVAGMASASAHTAPSEASGPASTLSGWAPPGADVPHRTFAVPASFMAGQVAPATAPADSAPAPLPVTAPDSSTSDPAGATDDNDADDQPQATEPESGDGQDEATEADESSEDQAGQSEGSSEPDHAREVEHHDNGHHYGWAKDASEHRTRTASSDRRSGNRSEHRDAGDHQGRQGSEHRDAGEHHDSGGDGQGD